METKVIILPETKPKDNKQKKKASKNSNADGCTVTGAKPPPRQRVITKTKRWQANVLENADLNIEKQYELLQEIRDNYQKSSSIQTTSHNTISSSAAFLYAEIRKKLHSYRHQDILKGKYDVREFIDPVYTIEKLLDSNLMCFYCKKCIYIWYMNAREPRQWTVERISNEIGHNRNNIEISCLSCNLSRRLMYHEKYRFTKQLVITKQNHSLLDSEYTVKDCDTKIDINVSEHENK